MATNYGPEATDIPVLQSAAPVNPGVVTPTISAEAINNVFSGINDAITGNKKKKAAGIVAAFTEKQLNVADALEQGKIPNSAYARSLMRKNLLDAIHENPSLAEDLIKSQSSIVDLAGGADIVKEGTDEERRWNDRKDSLVANGQVAADASESDFKAADLNQRQIVALNEQHTLRIQSIDERLKSLSLSSAERTELEGQKKDEAYAFVNKIAPSEFKRVKAELDKIVAGTGTAAEKQQAIEVFYAQFVSDAQQVSLGLSSEDSAIFRKPFEILKDTYLKQASGQYTAEDVKTQIEIATNTQLAIALADPDIARIAVATKLFGDNAFIQILAEAGGPVSKKMMGFVTGGLDTADASEQPSPFATGNTDRAAVKNYLDGIASAYNAGGDAKEESKGRIVRVLDSVADYEGLVAKNPKGAIELVNWLASPAFSKALQSDPSLQEHVDAAKEALNRNYSDEVKGMIAKQFTDNKVVSISGEQMGHALSRTENTDQIVAAQPTALGMEFVPIDPTNSRAVVKAKELNKELKPIINTQIRAWAHLDGRSDYGKYWEESSADFLGTDVGADAGDDIQMEDFKKLASLTSAYAPLQAAIDKTESGGSYDTLLGHSQKSGGAFEGVAVSQMTVGQAIEFSNGDYAEFSKDKVGRKATPMGRYQIVGATLAATAREMGLPPDTLFDKDTQDAMFAHLVQKAISTASTLKGKRAALRGVWEGFHSLSDAELDNAIAHFEGE